MDVRVVWTLEEWASAVVDLTVSSSLPERIVVVPNEHVAHALRAALIARGERAVLSGALFATALSLASDVLRDAGELLRPNMDTLGPCLVRDALCEVELSHFDVAALLASPEAASTIARAMGELEAVGLEPRAFRASPDPGARDLGRIMESLRASGALVTDSALFARAARLAPTCARARPTLAVVTGYESAAEAKFLCALPGVTLASWAMRPESERHRARLARLYGEAAALPLRDAPPARAAQRALGALQARLFTPASAERAPRDGSVELSFHDSPRDEADAALTWVAEQVCTHGVPLEEIALLAPSHEPWGALVRTRLAQLASETTRPLVRSETGTPLAERSDAARLLLVLRALRCGLGRDALAPVLPFLRSRLRHRGVSDLAHARSLLEAVAVPGGSRENLRAGRAWPEAWESALVRLEREQARVQVEELAGLAAAIEALTDVLRHVLADAPLSIVAMCLSTFARAHLRLAPFEPSLFSLLDQALAPFAGHEEREPTGGEALAWLEETLRRLRVPQPSAAHAGFYLGTLSGARGLSFRCVRLLGLSADALQRELRDDMLLSDAQREAISSRLLTSAQRAHRQRADVDAAVRGTRERLALSVPRASERGTGSPLLREVLAALGAGEAACARELQRPSVAALPPAELARLWHDVATRAPAPPAVASAPRDEARPREDATEQPPALGRRSPQFAAAVKLGLELLLTKRAGNADGATRRAARVCGLDEGCEAATDDVRRTFDALEASGLLAHPLRVSYPIVGVLASGASAVRMVDLIVQTPAELQLLTFVSHPCGRAPLARSHPEAIRQLQACAALLESSDGTGGRIVRSGLIFTGEGTVRWLSEDGDEGRSPAHTTSC